MSRHSSSGFPAKGSAMFRFLPNGDQIPNRDRGNPLVTRMTATSPAGGSAPGKTGLIA